MSARDWEEPFDENSDPPLNIHQMAEDCAKCVGIRFDSAEFIRSTAAMTIFASNQLEGVGLSLSETTTLLSVYERDCLLDHSFCYDGMEAVQIKATKEVLQHYSALLKVQTAALTKLPLTEDTIQQWHQTLMEGLISTCGAYRTQGVFAGQKIFPDHNLVPAMMTSFVSQLNLRLINMADSSSSPTSSFTIPPTSTKSAWAIAAWASHSFVSIHPFEDGNGRISRLIANYVLWYCGFPFPIPLSCSRKQYLSALRYADRDFNDGRRTGKLALIILSSAHEVTQNFFANYNI